MLEVINDVCRDEFNAQYFFEINGELFCLVGIAQKGNAFFRLFSDNKLFDLFIWSRAFCLNLATPDQHLR